jgi:uncharacterized protein (DUF1501 family)
MFMNRRSFVQNCSGYASLLALSPLKNFAFVADENASSEIFVHIFLRGGCDGLNLLAPVSDQTYVNARNADLRVNEPQGLALKNTLNGLDFCLHSKAAGLKELYDTNQLVLIHACGLNHGTRSHFDAMDLIERGAVRKTNQREGWLSRYLKSYSSSDALPAVAMSSELPASFLGSPLAVSMSEPSSFSLKGDARLAGLLKGMYKGTNALDTTAQRTLQTISLINTKLQRSQNGEIAPYQPENNADYPSEWNAQSFVNAMKGLARLIKADTGVHVATVDFGGWDTHENQFYTFAQLTDILSRTVTAFYNDMHRFHDRLTVVIQSEFGRRLKANKSNGTDHGHGNVMMVLGGKCAGGKMYGQWKGLETENLDNGVDLAVTTDYRRVLNEILIKRLGCKNPATVFPDFQEQSFLGFLA